MNEIAPVERDEKVSEYVPYGSQDTIKLSVKIVQNLIAVPTKSGKNCSERDALKFIMMCRSQRLNPFAGDAYLIGFDSRDGPPQFSLITAHQTYLKRAEIHPSFDGLKSGVIIQREDESLEDREGDFHLPKERVVGGWATVYFKDRKIPMHKRLRLARFAKPFGVWIDDAAGMTVKCAEADALRSSFPTLLGGLYMREEIDFFDSHPAILPPKSPTLNSGSVTNSIGTEPEQPSVPGVAFPTATPRRRRAVPPSQEPIESATVAASGVEPGLGAGAATTPVATTPEPLKVNAPPQPSFPPPPPTVPGEDWDSTQLSAAIQDALVAAQITQDDLMAFCRAEGLANEKQIEYRQLADKKLRSLLERWPQVINTIKPIRQ